MVFVHHHGPPQAVTSQRVLLGRRGGKPAPLLSLPALVGQHRQGRELTSCGAPVSCAPVIAKGVTSLNGQQRRLVQEGHPRAWLVHVCMDACEAGRKGEGEVWEGRGRTGKPGWGGACDSCSMRVGSLLHLCCSGCRLASRKGLFPSLTMG